MPPLAFSPAGATQEGNEMMIQHRRLVLATLALAVASPALAHHPGADLDQVMGDRENHFQAIDAPEAPAFELAGVEGNIVSLADFADKIVILNFIFAGCTDVCPLHAELIADIQEMIGASPMKDMVQFISVTTDPKTDTSDVLRAYGETHGLSPENWIILTAPPGAPDDATRQVAKTYGLEFTPVENGQFVHGVVTHVIDRNGRFAAKFHGLRFDPVNLVLYVNGLINNVHLGNKKSDPRLWDRVKGLFN
jgi:protein SCO1/2